MPRRMNRRAPVKPSSKGDYFIKRCTRCERWRRVDKHYYLRKDGRAASGWCKDCTKDAARERYEEQPYRHVPTSYRPHMKLLRAQKGLCFITGLRMTTDKPGRDPIPVRIDHKIRWVVSPVAELCNPLLRNTSTKHLSTRARKLVDAIERKGRLLSLKTNTVEKEKLMAIVQRDLVEKQETQVGEWIDGL